ncbi:MAG: RNA repair transcriptional activator RtcR family protein [Deltaproteobacteria bacterium]
MDILLTFAGNRDPFNLEIIQGINSEGPVLTLLGERHFQWIYIFTTPNTLTNAHNLQDEIAGRVNDVETSILNIDISDPTDYENLFLHMNRLCQDIMGKHKNEQPSYWIATASGTPQMQTIWFLLSRSGLVPATLLKITPPRFLRPRQKAVSEIHLPLDNFPLISSPALENLDYVVTLLRKEQLEAERDDIVREFSDLRMIGKSPALEKVIDVVRAASRYDSAVIIQGETGTGKELIARAVHFNSARKTEPFIVVNCAAIPETLVESELFGHEKGAFTGAIQQKKGKFELANKGTIFLDEIGDMPLPAQAKILRVLQDYEITRVGGLNPIKTDVRVIAATNRDLAGFVTAGKFREDLYYRLKVIDIQMPPLRDRKEDIPFLVEHFLNNHNHRYRQKKQLSREAMKQILDYAWPGNIRELENAMERAFVISKGNVIRDADLPPETSPSFLSSKDTPSTPFRQTSVPPEGLDIDAYLHDLEKSCYEEAIKMKDGNREAAARLLKIKPHTFRKRAKEKFGM